MQLNKADSKPALNLDAAKNTAMQNVNAQAVKNTLSTPINIPRSISSLLSSLNLPQEKLSADIIGLARFFSLPLKPELLADIRRQAFFQAAHAEQAAGDTKAESAAAHNRSMFSLAAAAAESKGVSLLGNALETFALAIDPDEKKDGDDHHKENKRNKDENEKEEKNEVNAVTVKKLALESENNNPVLSILNKLPGKNDQRWIVLPFEFNQDGKIFRVSMRVLFENENVKFVSIDIKTESREQRESFALEIANNNVNKIFYYTQEIVKNAVRKELAEIFNISCENVFIKTVENGDMPLPEAELGKELLQFIDEAV